MREKDKLKRFLESVQKYVQIFGGVQKNIAVDTVEWELSEFEHIFALLVLGVFVGLPSPPVQITLDLMPEMETDFIRMLEKVNTAANPLSDLFSIFDIG